MEAQLVNTALYSLLAGSATVAGIALLVTRRQWAERNSIFFISFSAGVVLAVAFTQLLPVAMENNELSLDITLFTLVAFYILEHTIGLHTCKEGDCDVHTMGVVAYTGIAFHSLMDGIVIGVGFETDFRLGVAATLGVLLHEIPEGITITALLLRSGYSTKATVLMGLLVALATPVGAIGSYVFVKGLSASSAGILLALGAGSFIYVGASDLIPETHKNCNYANILLVLGGAVLVYLIAYITGG